ncbi:MAG: hypothetical protein GC191_07490 [Azospirillum sp.]|nr:hypothetical protein [Azospirillum sp.]
MAALLLASPSGFAQTKAVAGATPDDGVAQAVGQTVSGLLNETASVLTFGWWDSPAGAPAARAPGDVDAQMLLPGITPPTTDQAEALAQLVAAGSGPVITMDIPNYTDPNTAVGAPGKPGLFGRAVDSVGYFFSYLWSGITSTLTPPSPASFAGAFETKDPYSFWYLLSETGYKLKEIESDVGLIPDVAFKFKYVRELSSADIAYLERKLERHARKYSDMLSVVQRSIIYTLLEINDSDTYFVEDFKIKLLPLPKAQFSLSPWESGLPEEFDVLLRAIQGKEVHYRRMGQEDLVGAK